MRSAAAGAPWRDDVCKALRWRLGASPRVPATGCAGRARGQLTQGDVAPRPRASQGCRAAARRRGPSRSPGQAGRSWRRSARTRVAIVSGAAAHRHGRNRQQPSVPAQGRGGARGPQRRGVGHAHGVGPQSKRPWRGAALVGLQPRGTIQRPRAPPKPIPQQLPPPKHGPRERMRSMRRGSTLLGMRGARPRRRRAPHRRRGELGDWRRGQVSVLVRSLLLEAKLFGWE